MALIKKVKNNKESSDTWCGQEILSGNYYEITQSRWEQWASDEKVNVDVANEELIVNNGSDDLNIIDGLNHLRAYISGEMVYTASANLLGRQDDAVSGTCAVNDTASVDFHITNRTDFPNQGQTESYTNKYIKGGQCYVINAEPGDWAEIQVIDIDNELGYGENVKLKQYIVKRYIIPNYPMKVEDEAPGEIPVNLYIRFIYHAVNSGSTRTFYINYDIKTKD